MSSSRPELRAPTSPRSVDDTASPAALRATPHRPPRRPKETSRGRPAGGALCSVRSGRTPRTSPRTSTARTSPARLRAPEVHCCCSVFAIRSPIRKVPAGTTAISGQPSQSPTRARPAGGAVHLQAVAGVEHERHVRPHALAGEDPQRLVQGGAVSASCAVVTSNPSRRSAAAMSAASFSGFGSRSMWA